MVVLRSKREYMWHQAEASSWERVSEVGRKPPSEVGDTQRIYGVSYLPSPVCAHPPSERNYHELVNGQFSPWRSVSSGVPP